MRYKHKFFLVNERRDNKETELAVCADEHTANFLAEHFRNTYSDATGLSVVYRYGRAEKIIMYARMPENKK